MRSHWSNSMTAQAFICFKMYDTLLQRKVFSFLIKRSSHERFYYLKGNMYAECTFAFSQNWFKENEVSLTQLNDSASFYLRKMYDILCKGKFLVPYQRVKSWGILLFERKYVYWMYFCFFIKLNQGEWGLIDSTQWQCKPSFAKMYDIFYKGKFLVSYQRVKSWGILLFERKYVYWMYFCFFTKLNQGEWGLIDSIQWQCKLHLQKCTTSFTKESFWFLIKGSNHEGFYYLKRNMKNSK